MIGPPEALRGEPEKSAWVDWNEAWKAARARAARRGGSEAWDRRAPSFARHPGRSGYVEKMLSLIDAGPSWSVLDVGCGSGALALPLARKVRSVIALDFSPRMLDILRGRCVEQGLGNVQTVLGAWEDDWEKLGIGACDLALASRSLIVEDLRGALLKLHRAARRQVILTQPVGTGPIDPRIFAAAGRTHVSGPDYLYPLNMLRQLGIRARLDFIPVAQAHRFASVGEALDGLAWMLPDPSPAELERLRDWLQQELVPVAGGLELLPAHSVCWAVLSWSKQGPAA
ncbi:MAG TPA: class I SAM-dependent methyltransferase [Myxococcales bacterium]|nr:class I SAM-dependent methyltransferase [Myxococcales bacterium]